MNRDGGNSCDEEFNDDNVDEADVTQCHVTRNRVTGSCCTSVVIVVVAAAALLTESMRACMVECVFE